MLKNVIAIAMLTIVLSSYGQKILKHPFVYKYQINQLETLESSTGRYKILLDTKNPLHSTSEKLVSSGMKMYSGLTNQNTDSDSDPAYDFLNLENTGLRYEPTVSGLEVKLAIEPFEIKSIKSIENDVLFIYSTNSRLTIKNEAGIFLLDTLIASPNQEKSIDDNAIGRNEYLQAQVNEARDNPSKSTKIFEKITDQATFYATQDILFIAKEILSKYKYQSRSVDVSFFSVKGKSYKDLQSLNDEVIETWRLTEALSKKKRISYQEFGDIVASKIPIWEKYVEMGDNPEVKKALNMNLALANFISGDITKSESFLKNLSIEYIEKDYIMSYSLYDYAMNLAKMNDEFTILGDRISFDEE